jgi:hypothetical protein
MQSLRLALSLTLIVAGVCFFSAQPRAQEHSPSDGELRANYCNQGKIDFNRCVAEIDTPEVQACAAQCWQKAKTLDEKLQCTKADGPCVSPLCRKVRQCENMEYLPW